MKQVYKILPLVIVIMLTSCIKTYNDIELTTGSRLPSFSAITDSGKEVNATSFDRGYGLIVFFNTNCPDCQKELPIIQNLYEKFKEDILFLAISRNEPYSSIKEYWEANALDLPFSAQEDAALFNLFAYHTIPRTYVIKNGFIVAQWDDNPTMTENDFIKITKINK